MNKKRPTVRLTIRITEDTYEVLKELSAKKNIGISPIVRDLIDKGLSTTGMATEINFIREMIREELQMIMKPHIDRLASLLVKANLTSASTLILTTRLLSIFLPPEFRKEYDDLVENARKQAIIYVKSQDPIYKLLMDL